MTAGHDSPELEAGIESARHRYAVVFAATQNLERLEGILFPVEAPVEISVPPVATPEAIIAERRQSVGTRLAEVSGKPGRVENAQAAVNEAYGEAA